MITSLVPYYGAKRQMADRIVAVLGKHTSYLSPFCGSLAVEFAKKPCRMEVVNDLNGALINLVKVVQEDHLAPELFEKLTRTAFCEELYEEQIQYLQELSHTIEKSEPLEYAYAYFVASWMGRNGFVGSDRELSSGFCKKFTSGGGDPGTRFRNATAGIPTWWERIRNMTVLSECGISLCERFEDTDGAAVYCDPPYLSKSAKYKHDFTEADHKRLSVALGQFSKTRVVVSYYEHPDLADLYPGWFKTFVKVQKNIAVGKVGGSKEAPEILLSNFEPAVGDNQ